MLCLPEPGSHNLYLLNFERGAKKIQREVKNIRGAKMIKNRGNICCVHSVSSGLFYEGANFMINGLPEISIKYFSELASIIILS